MLKTVRVDDLDGSSHDDITTVKFSKGTVSYEIDMSPENEKALDEALARFVDAARVVQTSPAKVAAKKKATDESERVRVWARVNGIPVADRGRIKADVIAQYHAATNTA